MRPLGPAQSCGPRGTSSEPSPRWSWVAASTASSPAKQLIFPAYIWSRCELNLLVLMGEDTPCIVCRLHCCENDEIATRNISSNSVTAVRRVNQVYLRYTYYLVRNKCFEVCVLYEWCKCRCTECVDMLQHCGKAAAQSRP